MRVGMAQTIKVEDFVTNERQNELIDLADRGLCAFAVRQAIREAVEAVRTGVPAAAMNDA